jgi:hypothetical protein
MDTFTHQSRLGIVRSCFSTFRNQHLKLSTSPPWHTTFKPCAPTPSVSMPWSTSTTRSPRSLRSPMPVISFRSPPRPPWATTSSSCDGYHCRIPSRSAMTSTWRCLIRPSAGSRSADSRRGRSHIASGSLNGLSSSTSLPWLRVLNTRNLANIICSAMSQVSWCQRPSRHS